MIATLYANTVELWPLRDGTVHVWSFACAQDPGRLASVLSDDELRAAHRFDGHELRARYVVQHSMMRWLLARYVDREPRAIQLGRLPHGKPVLLDDPQVELNLSHADDLALLAVTRGIGVGIDLERFDATLDVDALAPIVLAPDELAARGDRRAFLRIWCRKEACLKAIGLGLVDDLTSISANADRADIRGATVHVRDLFVSAAHAAALATTAACADVMSTALEQLATS